ncbi:MAG TPA: GEVED domain-containing protein, partial [Chitinophagales bacterium]|nr:GEVED domain-containing protein [Chitinophagales bacterium]
MMLTGVSAETITIPAANTNGTGGSTTNANKPYGNYYGYERSAMIYSKAEIADSGTITSIGFYVNSVSSPAASTPIRIYLKEVSKANFNDSSTHFQVDTIGATLVYDGAVTSGELVANTWITKTLTTTFHYSDTLNLLVLVQANYGGGGGETASGKSFRYNNSSTPNYYFQYWRADNNPPTGTGTTNYFRPNIQINLTPDVMCTGMPTAGTISPSSNPVCRNTSVTLTATGATGTAGVSYQWLSSLDDNTYTAIAGDTLSSIIVSDTVATYYKFVVTCTNSSLSDTSASVYLTLNSFTQCYCSATTNCGGDQITNVVFAGISDTTTCSNNGVGQFYNDTATVNRTISYPASITVSNGGTENVAVWIDYDHSGTFDASEFTAIGSGTGGVTFTNNVLIPATAQLGLTAMRVRVRYNTALTGTDACTSYTYGETEDYMVNILPAPTCTDPPTAGVITGDSTVCSGGTVTLTVSGYTAGTSLQWQISPDSLNWIDVPGFTSATETSPPVTS